jgi:transposase InsO family protein
VSHLGIEQIKIAPRSPWQNGYAERFVGTLRREVLDHVVVLGEHHLLRLVRSHAAYYNEDRATWRSVATRQSRGPSRQLGARRCPSASWRPSPSLREGSMTDVTDFSPPHPP